MISYLIYAAVSLITQPNATSICKTSSVCPIEWSEQINSHAHLEVQVKNDNDHWISTTSTGNSFLSIIVDENTNEYEWFVPQYLGQFWETPKRVVLEDMTTGAQYYSADFTVPGITLEMNATSNLLNAETSIPLTWSSNDDTLFGLFLLQDEEVIETIHNISLSPNRSYLWTVPYIPNQLLQIKVQSADENTYAFTDTFQIATTSTTSTTSTTPTSNLTTNDPHEPIRRHSILWYILTPLLIIIGILILYLVYSLTVIFYCSKNRIEPAPTIPSYVPRAISNPVYEGRPSRNSAKRGSGVPPPPISLPKNLRIISSYNNNKQPIYEEVPNYYHKLNRDPNHKLNRDRTIVNGVYV